MIRLRWLSVPICASALMAIASTLASGGNSLRQVWEFRLPGGQVVLDLGFSPDGSQLAVTTDAQLLILDVQNPTNAPRQFDLNTCGNHLAWSPDGNALLVCGHVVRLDTGSSCDLARNSLERTMGNLSNNFFWLSTNQLIRGDRTTTDLACQPLEPWQAESKWHVAGTEPTRGWIVLRQWVQRTASNGSTQPYNSYAIANRDSHALTSGLFLIDTFGDNTVVAPGASAVCSTVYHPGQSKPTLGCWNMPNGSSIPVAAELKDYVITRASERSAVVVAERPKYDFWGSFFGEIPDYFNLIVFDIGSGHRLASLKARRQHVASSNLRNWFFYSALSANGDLLAEGGDGHVRLLQLR